MSTRGPGGGRRGRRADPSTRRPLGGSKRGAGRAPSPQLCEHVSAAARGFADRRKAYGQAGGPESGALACAPDGPSVVRRVLARPLVDGGREAEPSRGPKAAAPRRPRSRDLGNLADRRRVVGEQPGAAA